MEDLGALGDNGHTEWVKTDLTWKNLIRTLELKVPICLYRILEAMHLQCLPIRNIPGALITPFTEHGLLSRDGPDMPYITRQKLRAENF